MEQPGELVGRALVVVVDDRTAHGEEDHSGPLVTELLGEAGFVVDGVVVVSADEVEIRNALNTAVIGGRGPGGVGGWHRASRRAMSPRKRPATSSIANCSASPRRCARPGLSAGIVDAGVSRGLAGISGSTLVVNLAGSRAAVRDGMATLNPLAVQIIGQLSSLEI